MTSAAQTAAKPRKPTNSKYWAHLHERKGGGFCVIRRGSRTGILKCAKFTCEHPTLESAQAEAERLASVHPGEAFEVWQRAVAVPAAIKQAAE